MMEDPFSFLSTNSSGMPSVRNVGLEALSRMTPAVKAPLEWATNQTFFQKGPLGGRSLDDLDPGMGRLIQNIRQQTGNLPAGRVDPVQLPKPLEFAVANSPLSRILTTARVASDPRKSVGERALNLLTGARTTTISPGAKEAILREKLSDFVRGYGGKQFTHDYLPKDKIDPSTPLGQLQLDLIQMMKQLNR